MTTVSITRATISAHTALTDTTIMEQNPATHSGGRIRRRKSNESHSSSSSTSSDSSTVNTLVVVKQGGKKKTTTPTLQRSNEGGNNKTSRNRRRRNRTRSHHNNKSKRKGTSEIATGDGNIPFNEDMYIAMDCEMVGVGEYGQRSMVARVTLIDWHGHTLMDEYIQPTEPVTDYRTFVSGITADDLFSCADSSNDGEEQGPSVPPLNSPDSSTPKPLMTLEECRLAVQSLIQDKILIGHALKNDLKSLGITHPWYLTRDTGKYQPFMKEVMFHHDHQYHFYLPHDVPTPSSEEESTLMLCPRKLCELSRQWLHREIQQPGQPHCPYEDALAALDLYKLVRTKWERVMSYKIQKTSSILAAQQEQQRRELDFPPLLIATAPKE